MTSLSTDHRATEIVKFIPSFQRQGNQSEVTSLRTHALWVIALAKVTRKMGSQTSSNSQILGRVRGKIHSCCCIDDHYLVSQPIVVLVIQAIT